MIDRWGPDVKWGLSTCTVEWLNQLITVKVYFKLHTCENMLYVETKLKRMENISSFLLINFNTLKLKLDIKTLYCIWQNKTMDLKGALWRFCVVLEASHIGILIFWLFDYVGGLERAGEHRQGSQQRT